MITWSFINKIMAIIIYKYAFYLDSVTSAFLAENESDLLSSKVSLFYN